MSRSPVFRCVSALVLGVAFSTMHANRRAMTEDSGATPRAFEFTYQVHVMK